MFNENHGIEQNTETQRGMKSKLESNHTQTGANRGDANGIWYVHAGEKRGH